MSFTGNFPRFNKVSADGKEIYFGDPTVSGSFRLREAIAGEIHLEKFNGSTWDDLGDIVTAAGIGVNYNVIADDNVDFDATVNFISISADKQLGAKNLADGKTTIVIVKNTDTSNHLVEFESGSFGTNSGDNATVIPPNSFNNVYACQGVDGSALAILLKDDVGNSFPTGVDGDLTILNGQTVQLTAGDIKDYNNIDIQAGGTLEIIDPSSTGNLTEIYAKTSFNIDGQLIGRSMPNGASDSGTTASGYVYSYSIPQNNGGAGGNGFEYTNASTQQRGFGGSQNNGYGGGGGGAAAGFDPAEIPAYDGGTIGGNGGTPFGNGGNSTTETFNDGCTAYTPSAGIGGSGGNGSFFNGQSGYPVTGQGGHGGAGQGGGGGAGGATYTCIFFFSPIQGQYEAGGGGGGAGKGTHGSSVLLWCASGVSGSGSVDLSGTVGGNGGNGGNGRQGVDYMYGNPWQGGGGGGGGAGGSGGTLYYKALSFTPSINVAGGAGGAGGSPGAAFDIGDSNALQATGGGAGSNGTAGSVIAI